MNKYQRSELNEMVNNLRALADDEEVMLEELKEAAEEASSTCDNMADEEQDKLDNMPENLQWSERADEYQENIDILYDAMGEFDVAAEADDREEAVSSINAGIDKVEEIL